MQVYLRTITCKMITLDLEQSDTIENLRAMVQEKEGIPAEQVLLTLEGTALLDGRTAEDYGIQHGTTLRLLVGPAAPEAATAASSSKASS